MWGMNLAEFLLARIAEDEAAATAATVANEVDEPSGYAHLPDDGPHIARWSPARVLAECEAKRGILRLHSPPDQDEDGPIYKGSLTQCRACGPGDSWMAEQYADVYAYPCPTVEALALPYADHPDYQQEWGVVLATPGV